MTEARDQAHSGLLGGLLGLPRRGEALPGEFESLRALLCLGGLIIVGLVMSTLFGLWGGCLESAGGGVQSATCILLVAGASLLVGGALGFLFGVPRAVQRQEAPATSVGSAERERQETPTPVRYGANTNLEEISDWLTKILVGVGLTQLRAIPEAVASLGQYVAPRLGTDPANEVFAICVMLYFAIAGFLFAYLWARLFLMKALQWAEGQSIGAVRQELAQLGERTTKELQELRDQSTRDAEALMLVQRQLTAVSSPTPEALTEALRTASRLVRSQAGQQAQVQRASSWREQKERMEQTIPVFQALIACDAEGRDHANRAQLGFALKDQREPAWSEAERLLSEAINIRGSWRSRGSLLYEFNRAVCRVHLDEAFAQGKPANDPKRAAILRDLRAACTVAPLRRIVAGEPTILGWLSANGLAPADLEGAETDEPVPPADGKTGEVR